MAGWQAADDGRFGTDESEGRLEDVIELGLPRSDTSDTYPYVT